MDQVEQVKQKTDIVQVIGQYVTLKKGGRNFKGLCPFHGEKSPSFMVSPELQIYKCFGCGKGGDVFGFLEEMEGMEFGEVLRMLAEKAGVRLESKLGKQNDEKTDLIKIQEQAAEYYHYLLTKHNVGKVARDYLNKRKITDKLIEQFRLGFALSSWDGLYKYLVEKKQIKEERVEKAGLVIKGDRGRYDRFRGRVMFPLTDGRGRVIAFAGRILPAEVSKPAPDREEPKYINSPETEIYHKSQTLYGLYQAKQAIKKADRVIIVEGELDMISSFAAGVTETVAIKGSALTEDQVAILARLTKNVILALDADEAGMAAMKRGIEIAERMGMSVKIARIEGGKDPDDIARENPSKWKQMLAKAVDVYEFYIQAGLKNHDIATVEGKRRFSAEVLPLIGSIENQVVRSFYVRKIGELLGVNEESVLQEAERVKKVAGIKNQTNSYSQQKEVPSAQDRQEKLEGELLALVLAAEAKVSRLWTKELIRDRLDGAVGRVLEEWWRNEGKLAVAEFINQLAPELKEVAQIAYLKELSFDHLERDWQETVKEWKRLVARKRLAALAAQMKQAEIENNDDTKQLEEEFREWTRALNLANNESE